MTYGDKPFGLRDIKLTNITGTVQVDLPVAMQLTITPILLNGKLRGDDRVKALVALVDGAEWAFQNGGINLAALAVIVGQAATTTGSSPNEKTTLNLGAGDAMPYFKIYGKAVGDGIDDIHVKLFKCKCLSLNGQFQDGQFWITNCSGEAIDDDSNGVVEFVQNETATTLPTS